MDCKRCGVKIEGKICFSRRNTLAAICKECRMDEIIFDIAIDNGIVSLEEQETEKLWMHEL